MPTVREVHDAFEKMLDEQRSLRGQLTERRSDLQSAKDSLTGEQGKAMRGALSRLLGGFETPALTAFQASLSKAGADIRPASLYAERKADVKDAQDNLDRMGQPAKPADSVEKLGKAREAARSKASKLGGQIKDLNAELKDINTLEGEVKGKGLPGFDDTAYWGKFRLGRWLTSSTWRKGRQLVQDWEGWQPSDNLKALLPKDAATGSLTEIRNTLPGQMKATKAELDAKAKQLGADIEARGYHDRLRSDDEIRRGITAEILEEVLAKPALVEAIAQQLPDQQRDAMLTRQAKIVGYEKLSASLDKRISGVDGVISQLDKPMSKLKRGKRARPSKSLDRVDLEDIRKKVATGTALNTLALQHAGRAADHVQRWTPSRSNAGRSNDDFTMNAYTMMLVGYLLLQNDTDNFFTATSFEGAGAAAAAVGVDLGNLSPDVAGLDVNAAGLEGLDMDALKDINIDLGNVDVGGVDVGGIDVGTIDVPTIDVPTIDTGSMGGFDGGGSFGGGFDGGGGF